MSRTRCGQAPTPSSPCICGAAPIFTRNPISSDDPQACGRSTVSERPLRNNQAAERLTAQVAIKPMTRSLALELCRVPDFSRARERMVEIQIARRGIRDSRVLDAMQAVPRELFVEPGFEALAYEDGPLPIEASQTISQPYIVAFMIEAAELKPTARVLEVGAGSGYATAVMSRIVERVYGIERHAVLVEAAQRRIAKLGYDNVELRVGDGTCGWPQAAPFDAILVAASGPEVPQALKEQLVIGGRLLIPVGAQRFRQTLRKITRLSEAAYQEEDLGGVAFVPLIGEHGWLKTDGVDR
jgi:protein-L-isoaspartate(D-aspartate) O-methyltransferase